MTRVDDIKASKKTAKLEQKLVDILARIDIELQGTRPQDIRVHDPRFYQRLFREPSLGLGESYMDGWWDCDALDEFFFRVFRHVDAKDIYKPLTFLRAYLKNLLTNQQNRWRSKRVAKQHYNIGNDLYEKMLGKTMAYTCAYWSNATTLDEAQTAKYDLICRKLDLQPGEQLLELGCGWGGFAKYAAEQYGVSVTGVNIATEQMRYAKELCKDLPVNFVVSDYRDQQNYNPDGKKFDKVVSIGMCEHVGYKNYKTFFQTARDQLKESGLFLMHTIGKNISLHFADPWIQKYIFPSGMLPSIKLMAKAAEGRFVIEDLHNFGINYDRTLMEWDKNFVASWPTIKQDYDERFYRMWRFYLLSCAAAFRSRSVQLWQYVFSPNGRLGGYASIR